jgi:ferritin-like metal-binding protein YciE
MPETTNTEQSFIQQIQSLFSAEKMLTEALPKMMVKAESLGLQKSLAHHLAETDQHKEALRLICKTFDVDPEAVINEDMKTIIEEGDKAIGDNTDGNIDAVIIASAKKVEEYEISQYETVSEAAKSLGYEGIAARLRLTQEEENQALTKLSFMAKELPYRQAQLASI